MRQLVFFMLFILLQISAAAQANGIVVGGKWADQVSISDVNGRPFEKKYDDVNGQPFFDANPKWATITLADGKVFRKVKSRINLVDQTLVFTAANNVEAFITAGSVREISYDDTSAMGIVKTLFRTGYPGDNRTINTFYQVLAEGRCSLLKSIVKKISERKNELSGEVSKEIETNETYYLYRDNQLTRIKKDRSSILPLLADRKELVQQYLNSEKPNLKNDNELAKLINYYNQQP